MTKRNTKRGIIVSMIVLTMCFASLVGTTFAWFTDSVTSAGNIIQTGTLDVNLYWAEGNADVPTDGSGWTPAKTGAIFTETKWEPGCVVAKHLKVTNEGNLALKYSVKITPTGEYTDLANVIDVYFLDDATKIEERSNLNGATPVGTLADLIVDDDGAAHGIILPVGATAENGAVVGEKTVTIVFKMKTTADNEYQDKEIGSSFVVKVLATQLNYESDDIDNNYDAGLIP